MSGARCFVYIIKNRSTPTLALGLAIVSPRTEPALIRCSMAVDEAHAAPSISLFMFLGTTLAKHATTKLERVWHFRGQIIQGSR